MKRRLLIIEDDSIFCQTMQGHMQGENIEFCFGKSLANGLEDVLVTEYCLLIAAIQPAKSEDIEMLRVIRNSRNMPIIVLADKMTADDKVRLFHAGANACVERPIHMAVFAAQAISLLHLYLAAKEEDRARLPLTFGSELIIDTAYRQAIVDGEPLELTCKEFELLVCLATHPCQVWSRTQLYRHVWNDTLGLNGDHTVKTHIGNLKKKLTALGKNYIQNSRGVGYRFVPPKDDLKP